MADPQVIRVQSGSARKYTPLEAFPEPLFTIFSTSLARSERLLAEDFTGITTAGAVEPGLFPSGATGVSLQPVLEAARRFQASLDAEQRKMAAFDLDSDAWRKWHNMHVFFYRHGVCLQDLDEAPRTAALELVRATLSAAGYENARDVMKLNEHVAELSGRTEEYGEWFYYMSIFGEPSETEPWGWQLDGHHLIINAFVLGDQLVLTPHFSGSEPVLAKSGKYAGTRVFAEEERTGLALMKALSPEQQAVALRRRTSAGGGYDRPDRQPRVAVHRHSLGRAHARAARALARNDPRLCGSHPSGPRPSPDGRSGNAPSDQTHFAWAGSV